MLRLYLHHYDVYRFGLFQPTFRSMIEPTPISGFPSR